MQDIIIRGLCKSFGEKAVLCNVSGTLAAGRITGLMAFGSGKNHTAAYSYGTGTGRQWTD